VGVVARAVRCTALSIPASLAGILWFPPASIARRHPRPGVAYRTVTDLSPLRLALAWPQESRSPAVAAFVRTACSLAAAAYPSHETERPAPARESATGITAD
jgi:hypothetical protein